MENNIINPCRRSTFLVKFQFSGANDRYICQGLGLFEVLKTYDKNGIEFIKQFDFDSNSFKRCSLESILKQFNWDTEFYLYLQKHYYFKDTCKRLKL